MLTASQIVEALGDTTFVATNLGLSPSTVQGWKTANFIPEWRRPALLRLAKRIGKPLGAGDFPPVTARRSRKEAA